jgi:branched-chain amino acid transport system permease protein
VIWQLIINGLFAGILVGLVAVGFSLVYNTARFFHAAHAGTYLIGAYAGIWVSNHVGMSPFLALVAAIAAAIGLGLLMELAVYRPLRKAGSSSHVLFLSSLALLLIVQNSIALMVGSEIQVVRSPVSRHTFQVFGGTITSWQVLTAGVTIATFAVTWFLLRFTVIGKKMRAVATDPQLAEVVGINPDNVLVSVIVLGSALAGLAGFLTGYDTAVTPTSGFGVVLVGITAAVVGGVGSVRGAMLGGLLVGAVQHIGLWKLPAAWQDAIVFVILILFLLSRPRGFLGRGIRRVEV